MVKNVTKNKLDYLTEIKFPHKGDVIKGNIISIDKYAMYVDLPGLKTGVVWAGNIKEIGKSLKDFKVGDEVTVILKDIDNEYGLIELEIKDGAKETKWSYFKELLKSGEPVEEKVVGVNRGGLIIELKGVRGFLPVSQLSREKYPKVENGDKDKILDELKKFVGQKMRVKVIGVEEKNEKLFFSEKEYSDEEIKKAIEKFKVGDIVEGTVSNIVDFGVFVNINSVDANGNIIPIEGLIHISELDWQLVDDPKELLKVGDKIQAKVISIENGRISLSLKQLKDNPWEIVAKKYQKGDIVTGIATKYNPFGVFVKIDNLVQALCHISEFGSEKIMKDTIELGKEYKFIINLFDPTNYKVGLKLIKEDGSPKNLLKEEKNENKQDEIKEQNEEKGRQEKID